MIANILSVNIDIPITACLKLAFYCVRDSHLEPRPLGDGLRLPALHVWVTLGWEELWPKFFL